MYRLGFRALEEIAEAGLEELVQIDGVDSEEQAQTLKAAAETAMERLRQARIKEASSGVEPLTEREKLRFVQGVGLRTLQLLEEAGYRTAGDVAKEDPDRLAIRSGLGIKKVRLIQQGAVHFLQSEAQEIEVARARYAQEKASDGEQPTAPADGQ
jgi:N utilization substance protein A